ncbi:DUF4159 domain-containing protein, partial [Candidatus Sumerlaeota bacterium]|nr:DUF4159 domain-containing protein [Candidatus Sumerlaeota bacterium]
MSRRTLFLAALLVFGSARAWPDADPFQVFKQQKNILLPNKFTFLRVEYDSVGGYGEAEYDYDGRHWLRWQTDFPEADENFIFRLAELTAIDPNPHTEVRRLTAPDLFKFPLIYMSDPGWMDLSKEEVAALRNYLLQGGFLWVDDFWGDAEWENLERTMKEVFPGQTWQPVPKDHPIMNIVYPLKECPQVPARDFATMGWKYDPPAIHKAE